MFSQKTLEKWSEQRVLRFVAKLARDCESNWEDAHIRSERLTQISQVIRYSKNTNLQPLETDPPPSLDAFITFLAKIEQKAGMTMADGEPVRTVDGPPYSAEKIPLTVIAHNLRSAFNVGSLFRTAECLGAKEVILTGGTPTPEQNQLRKSAMGADELVTWSTRASLEQTIDEIKSKGIKVVALETVEEAPTFDEFQWTAPIALVVGNERQGLPAEVLKDVDGVVQIPVYGWKNSLNVAVAFSICGYHVARQLRKQQT